MKSITALLMFIATLNVQMYGQPTFQKYYHGGGNAQNHIGELSNGHISIGIGSYSSGNSIMDPQGNILHAHSFVVDTFLVLQSVRKLTDNEFSFAGGYYYPGVAIHPVIGIMDSTGNVIRISYYALNLIGVNNAVGDIELLSNNKVVAWNRPSLSSNSFFALMVDSVGDVIWARNFDQQGQIRFIKEFPNGDLLAGIDLDGGGAAVARMNASGTILWAKSYIRPGGVMMDGEIESDSSFTVIGYTDKDSGPGTKLFMMHLNGTGDVQWCKGYEAPAGWLTLRARIDKALDGKYAILANILGQGGGKAFLMKTDLNGDTLWTQATGVASSSYNILNLLPYSDGGFLFNGYTNDYGSFLFKSDSIGRLPCPEHEHYVPVQVQDLFPTDSSFTLTSIDGATRHPAFINDTIYPPVITIEGCTVTQVPNYGTKPSRPRIRPNPNRGQFTVQFNDPLQVDSFYSVYDLAGKLLYQRPLPTSATIEDIDLSRFGKGTYLLRFTTPNEVWNERVVVE